MKLFLPCILVTVFLSFLTVAYAIDSCDCNSEALIKEFGTPNDDPAVPRTLCDDTKTKVKCYDPCCKPTIQAPESQELKKCEAGNENDGPKPAVALPTTPENPSDPKSVKK